MKRQIADYQVVPYTKIRYLEAIAYRSVQHKSMMHGLIEVDVSRARAFLREHKAQTTVGGIGEKPGGIDGHIAIREYLSLTLSFNHETIDGAVAARFTQRLKDLIESAYGLFDSTVEVKEKRTPLVQEENYVYNTQESNFS